MGRPLDAVSERSPVARCGAAWPRVQAVAVRPGARPAIAANGLWMTVRRNEGRTEDGGEGRALTPRVELVVVARSFDVPEFLVGSDHGPSIRPRAGRRHRGAAAFPPRAPP